MTTDIRFTPEQYAEAFRLLLKSRSLEELNDANHLALEKKEITLDHFLAAARVLAKVIIDR